MGKVEVQTIREGARGCGYKQEGGIYLVSEGIGDVCCKLPIKLDVCPTCGHGIKPSRGWTWIDVAELIKDKVDRRDHECDACPLGDKNILKDDQHGTHWARVGLLWIGGSFYTPRSWYDETQRMGASRRIPAIPKDFVLGETLVCVAHREHKKDALGKGVPAIFHIFKPTAIQYVVKPRDGQKKLKRMIKRGITPVRIERLGENGKLFKGKP